MDEKTTFLRICEDIGTSSSNALRMFVATFNKCGGFPSSPASPCGFSPETLQTTSDAEAGRVYGPFDTVEAMIESLNRDQHLTKLEYTVKFKKDYENAFDRGETCKRQRKYCGCWCSQKPCQHAIEIMGLWEIIEAIANVTWHRIGC